MKSLYLILALVACGHKDPLPKEDPPQEILDKFDAGSARLLSLSDDGWVVSRNADGGMEHVGDSLIWTGIAMAELSCTDGEKLEDNVLAMMDQLGGGLARYPSMPAQISADGTIGVYRGAAHRIVNCPGSAAKWAIALQKHLDLDRFNPSSDERWFGEFRYVPELALAVATDASHPDPRRLDELAGTLETWALGVQIAHSACFRVNLAYQTIRTVQELGEAIPATRHDNFCATARGMRLGTVEHLCGRDDFKTYIDNFQQDLWEYQHQRCPSWEDPDGHGFQTPGLDLLEAIREAYHLVP